MWIEISWNDKNYLINMDVVTFISMNKNHLEIVLFTDDQNNGIFFHYDTEDEMIKFYNALKESLFTVGTYLLPKGFIRSVEC